MATPPRPARDPYPFLNHRTCAEVDRHRAPPRPWVFVPRERRDD